MTQHTFSLNRKQVEKLTEIFHERIKEEDIKFKQLCFYVND